MTTTLFGKQARIIVAGGRDFTDYALLSQTLDAVLEKYTFYEVQIVSGCCRGADALGEHYAKEHRIPVKRFPADWLQYGKVAGPIRNREMAEYASEGEGVLVAFWDGKSRGTASMIRIAEKAGLQIKTITY
ncbi:MAG: DUF2493 domain-containing protein [Succiniclasticum sp.]|uniref:DUF2493 domain-containing protein n=1 Tax=Succiniclasticum sp. TaxID=2775030 RepID=UPI002A914843|nr:DUF2493 domain-containing protein [Succiniclasticum sp.]MDY6291110.1 DUF2493 domain-containing protein [Succiniclasticum sp.]